MKMICEVAGCGEELSERTGSMGGPMMCPNCRTSSYYWKKQTLTHMRLRHKMLGLFSSRMEHYDPRVIEVINNAKKAVASHNKRARSATAAAADTRH